MARDGTCRGWSVLPAAAKLQLVDSLCSNLSVLATSAAAAAAAGGDADAAVLKAHRTALKVYFFFLHWVASTAEADAASASASAAAVAPTKVRCGQHWLASPRGVCVRAANTHTHTERMVSRSTLTSWQGKGKTSKKAAVAPSTFDWDAVRAKVVRPLEVWMDMDLTPIYRGFTVEEDLLNLCVRLAQLFLEVNFSPPPLQLLLHRPAAKRARRTAVHRHETSPP
jgi:hypothetical protein